MSGLLGITATVLAGLMMVIALGMVIGMKGREENGREGRRKAEKEGEGNEQ